MPIYEYECLQCGKRTELLQRMDEAPLAACPECGGQVRKLLSAPAFQFKGSGFYKTDYVDKKGDKAEKPESKPESKPEPKTESSTSSSSAESKSSAAKASE
jgi:putative FmdB family regulatory protein